MHRWCSQSVHRLVCSPSGGWHVRSVQPSSTQARSLRSKRQRMVAEWCTGGNLAGCLEKIWETPSHCQNMLRHKPAIITHPEGPSMGWRYWDLTEQTWPGCGVETEYKHSVIRVFVGFKLLFLDWVTYRHTVCVWKTTGAIYISLTYSISCYFWCLLLWRACCKWLYAVFVTVWGIQLFRDYIYIYFLWWKLSKNINITFIFAFSGEIGPWRS